MSSSLCALLYFLYALTFHFLLMIVRLLRSVCSVTYSSNLFIFTMVDNANLTNLPQEMSVRPFSISHTDKHGCSGLVLRMSLEHIAVVSPPPTSGSGNAGSFNQGNCIHGISTDNLLPDFEKKIVSRMISMELYLSVV